MQNWTGVIPTSFPKPKVLKTANAISIPFFNRKDPRNIYGSGLFFADGRPIDISLAMTSAGMSTNAIAVGDYNTYPVRQGAWMFGGVLLNHFGHALMDTTSRLWAVQRLLDDGVKLNGIIFYNKKVKSESDDQTIPKTSAAIFDLFPALVPIISCNRVEIIEELYVPEPGISSHPESLIGRPEQIEFFRKHASKIAPYNGPSDIYISRTGNGARGSHLFEAEIEKAFADEGYYIFNPEHHSLKDQIAVYRAARRLVSIDGSALHLAAMSVPRQTKVAILSRRQFYAWAIADQMRAFANCDVTIIEAHSDVYNLASALENHDALRYVGGWSSSYVMTRFDHLGQELVRAKFLSKLPDWPTITPADITAALDKLSARLGERLLPVPDDLQPLEPYYHAHLKQP